jgi:hypothetical protein
MQEVDKGGPVTDINVWKKMKMKKAKQPGGPDEYYGTAGEDLDVYRSTFEGYHPEVEDPFEEEIDETALIVAGHGKQHGRHRILDAVISPTTSLTRIKATHTDDHPPIPPPRQPRSRVDVSISS